MLCTVFCAHTILFPLSLASANVAETWAQPGKRATLMQKPVQASRQMSNEQGFSIKALRS